MKICYLGLGSNLNSPVRQLRLAIQYLKQIPSSSLLAIAPFYPNEAVGRRGQPKYCNTVVKFATTLPPEQLLDACQAIEAKQGRVRRVRWGARPIDIDILYYGHLKINSARLILPHPRIKERAFVLQPLNDLCFAKPSDMPVDLLDRSQYFE